MASRDGLAKALYCRTVTTIVKRANSLRRPLEETAGSGCSDESVNQDNNGHQGKKIQDNKDRTMVVLHQAMDGFIGVLDMFGFEDSKPSQLEQLCINLAGETMQHFYNTHTLKTAIQTCREEEVHCNVDLDYADNAHCIDLISSLVTFLKNI